MNSQQHIFIAFLISVMAITFTLADPIPFKDCGSMATVEYFDISNCPKLPCEASRGTNVTMSLKITPKQNYNKATNLVWGIIAGVKVPFPLPQADACSAGFQCPLQQGTSYTESITMPILQSYPPISVYVQYEVVDDNNKLILCALFPMKIQ